MGYDRAVTVFTPDGRLIQVEYAREAVKRGTTAVGIETSEGVVLLADKRIVSRLLKPEFVDKIFILDTHIGVASSGLTADARKLIDAGRSWVQENKIKFDEPIDVETLAKNIANYKQAHTQYGGIRPFGVGLIIAGVYAGESYLFETDPSGALLGYKATAIGSGKSMVVEMLEQEYEEDIKLEDAILLGLKALYQVTEGKVSSEKVDIGIAELKTGEFRILIQKEFESYIKKIKSQEREK